MMVTGSRFETTKSRRSSWGGGEGDCDGTTADIAPNMKGAERRKWGSGGESRREVGRRMKRKKRERTEREEQRRTGNKGW